MRSKHGGRFGWVMTVLLITICACMSWAAAVATFAARTGLGVIYEDSLSPSNVDANEELVSVTERDAYLRSWKVSTVSGLRETWNASFGERHGYLPGAPVEEMEGRPEVLIVDVPADLIEHVWEILGVDAEDREVPSETMGRHLSDVLKTEGLRRSMLLNVVRTGWDRTWREWALGRGGGVLEFDVYLDVGEGRGNTITLRLWAGRLREIPARRRGAECELSEGGEARAMGYGLWWEFSGSAFDRIRALYGSDAATGCRVLVAYEGAKAWAPYARDATVSVPRGGMVPLMGMLLERSVEGLGGSMDQAAGDAVARRLVDEITAGLDYARLEDVVDRVAYAFGPVQFLTLSTMYMTVFLLVVSLRTGWARGAAGISMNLIPYIGFFGTLLGMGAALGVLGEANLSDPVSKATNLGPIGSRLALAIETTKYALVCFGVVSVAALLRDAMVGRGADERET